MMIRCTKCGQMNRLNYQQSRSGQFSCGACRRKIGTFASNHERNTSARTKIFRFVKRWSGPLSLTLFLISISAFYILLGHNLVPSTIPTVAKVDTLPATSPPWESSQQGVQNTQNTIPQSDAWATPKPPYSLPNGTILIHSHKRPGHGSLTISNGTNEDAVVKLVGVQPRTDSSQQSDSTILQAPRKAFYGIYVRANSNATITNIGVGGYEVVFSSGRDWSKTTKLFTRNASYKVFDESLIYTETRSIDEDNSHREIHTSYKKYSITLHTVADGNAQASSVSKADFDVPEGDDPS